MFCKVKFLPSQKIVCIDEKATIMDAERDAELGFEYPCGGNGTCNKCMVDVEINGKHKRVMACQTRVEDGMIITLNDDSYTKDNKVLTCGIKSDCKINPCIEIYDSSICPLGVAFDIGTTTIAAYLLNLKTAEVIDTLGELNKQVKYGGDVISRCIFSVKNGVDEIHNCVVSQMDEMIAKLLKSNGKSSSDIFGISVVGNTCMHHIFNGICPTSLVEIPYMPTVYERMTKPASEYFKNVNNCAKLFILPVIAGFVGADTVGAMLATKFYEKEKPTLLIDIGTNGEMVLGTSERFVACSTASGPAFEGAKIKFGMRGAEGAIDHVKFENGELIISVINNVEAKGICGSGLIDIIAVLLDNNVIINSGRFNKNYDGPLLGRITEIDGSKCFKLTDKIYLTQKDIREVQLAKGAIAAGIEIMSKNLGIGISDINEVLIAGAFGNFMNPTSMCKINLIPNELLNKIVPIGNAAGEGSKLCLISKDEFELSENIARKAEFIELASHDKFQETFIKQLDF